MSYVIIIAVLTAAFAALWFWVFKPTAVLFEQLRSLKERAEAASEVKEVELLWEELKVVSKQCWHRSLSAEARIIAAILNTKYEALTKPGLSTTLQKALQYGSEIVETSTGRVLKLVSIDLVPNGAFDSSLVAVIKGSDEKGSIQATSNKFHVVNK